MAYRFVLPLADVGNGISPSDGALLYFFDFGTSTPKTTYSDFALTTANTSPVVADADGLFSDIYLDVQASVTLRDRNNVVIWGPKDIYAPDDSISALAASNITVLDAGGNFVAVNVETVLAEIATDYVNAGRISTITADMTFNGANLNMADNVLSRPEIRDYSITSNSIASASGVLTIDLSTGNDFYTTLTENITSIVISNPPASGLRGEFALEITQDAVSSFTVAQPGSVIVVGGATYAMSSGNDAIDDLTYRTRDGGTIWKLDFSQAYA